MGNGTGKGYLFKEGTALFKGNILAKPDIGHIILEGKDVVTDDAAAFHYSHFTGEILCIQELCAILRVAETVVAVPEVPLKLLLRRCCGDCQNLRDCHLEILYVLYVFFQHYLRLHFGNFLEKLELVCWGEIYLVFILSLAPPLVECDGVSVIGNAGLYLRAESREVYEHLEAGDAAVILVVCPAKFGYKGSENLHLVYLQGLFLDYHAVDTDRVLQEPFPNLESLRTVFTVQSQEILGIVNFLCF